MTSRRRTLAALALEDTKGPLEDGVKLVTGERRSLEASEAGSWPRVEVLKHSDTRSCDLLPLVIPVQISRDSRRLNTNKIACDPIDNRLEHGDVWIPGDRRGSLRVSVNIHLSLPGNDAVQDLAAQAGDHHGRQHRAPAVSENLTGVNIAPGNGAADLNDPSEALISDQSEA